MKNIFQQFGFCLAVLLFAASAFAQTSAPPRTVSGGVLNGKATNLVKPAYPAAAKAVNAAGAVNVQVTIDENGDVISAAATSGHPLLRAASVEAARQSKFSPTVLHGTPVKVTGVIVYNFSTGAGNSDGGALAPNWFSVGMMLGTLDRTASLLSFNPTAVLQAMPADWTTERQQVQRLEELRKQEFEISTGSAANSDAQTGNSNARGTMTLKPNKTISPEQIALAQSLTSSLQGRLAANNLNLWYFNLGVSLNQAVGGQTEAVNSLRQFAQSAPAEVSKETVDELQYLLSILERRAAGETQSGQVSGALSRLYATLFAGK